MMIICEKDKCTGCSVCEDVCPKKAIIFQKDKHGFFYPKIDEDLCISCGMCEHICPVNNCNMEGESPIKIYSAWTTDSEIRKKSTSGGVFSVIANKILSEGGVVAGVKWNKEFCAEHTTIMNEEELYLLNGSKYVESHSNSIYLKIKQFLKEGYTVLFSGTPCQNHALRLYLGGGYDNLILIDLVCHGVPSEDVFKRYLLERSKGNLNEVKDIKLRHKNPYWDWSYVTISFFNLPQYSVLTNEDSYFALFNIGYTLRKSCSNCQYTNMKRYGDITLADFWGYKAHNFKTSDYLKGVSLVMINSEKGMKLFSKIQDNLIFEEVSKIQALNSNKALKEPFSLPKNDLMAFWKDYDEGLSIDDLRDKYTGVPYFPERGLWIRRIFRRYKWIIKK